VQRDTIPKSSFEKIAKETETPEDRENEGIRKLQRDGMISKFKIDGNHLTVEVSYNKWTALTENQKRELLTGFVSWLDRRIPEGARSGEVVSIECPFLTPNAKGPYLARFSEGKSEILQ